MNDDAYSGRSTQHSADEGPGQFFLAQFENLTGRIMLSDKMVPKDDERERKIAISGEMLVAGRSGPGETIVIEEIRRVSLGSSPIEELRGILSVAGPANEIKFDPGLAGKIEPFDMRLYYPLLSGVEPACTESDAVYPQLEALQGRLTWESESSNDPKIPRVRIEISLGKLVESHVGAVETIVVESSLLSFQLVEERPTIGLQANSLAPCDMNDAPTASNGVPTISGYVLRELKVRFVRLFDPTPALPFNMTLDNTVKELINGACEVWWKKGGLKIAPTSLSTPNSPDVDLALQACLTKYPGGKIAPLDEGHIRTDAGFDSNSVNVYLAAELTGNASNPREGGGITHGCRTSEAFIILDIRKAATNRYLLAHEIGHVLGLRHPGPINPQDPCSNALGITPGAFCSVMVPDSPDSSRNTPTNLAVLNPTNLPTVNTNANPLWPVLQSTTVACGWRKDDEQGYFHIIRDYPCDDGTEPPQQKPATYSWMPRYLWTHSDVWNCDKQTFDPYNFRNMQYADPLDPTNPAKATPMFGGDFSPNHGEPTYSGPNYMYVRLHTCEKLDPNLNPDPNKDVKVYLYLAVPGASNEPLVSVPVASGPNSGTNPLIFTSTPPGPGSPPSTLPTPGVPKVVYMKWEIPLDPLNPAAAYPAHCCVFAVAKSGYQPTPSKPGCPATIDNIIATPASYRFYHLACYLDRNDVAQRNLNLQGTPPGSGASSSSMLAWVEMANPFDEAAPARLEIDTTQASGLQSLALEVNDKIVREIKPGEQTTVTLIDALRPEDHMILRLRATIPPDSPVGMSFPIDLRFVVNDQLISGYTHILSVVPLSEAVLQVLDLMYGALRAVAIGCKSKQAQMLADKMERIVWDERVVARQPQGCSGLLWMILRRKNEWRSAVTKLSESIAALAKSLESDDAMPECVAVRRQLYKLSDQLATKDIPDAVFIEGIRDLADRIQEPAGRLARRLLSAQK